MKHNYSVVLFLFLILSLLLAPASFAEPSIIVSSYTLTPSTLMPGEKGILSLTITNAESTGTTTTTTTTTMGTYTGSTSIVKVNGATIDEIRITSAYDGTKQIKAITKYTSVAYLTAGASIDIDFEITADENISEGAYFPKVQIDLEEDDYKDIAYPFLVKISNSTVDLLASNIPSKMAISGSTDITLKVVNNRDNAVSKVTITPTEIEGIQFYPNNIFLGNLNANSYQNVSFSIEPSDTGLKNLSFTVNYYNGENQHENTLETSIEIIETNDVAPVLYYFPAKISKGATSKIRVEVYNSKRETISGVIVTPITNVKISPSQYFIGSMDPDDVFSASFDIYTEDLEIDSDYSVDFKVTYKQGDNYYDTPILSSSFKIIEPAQKDTGFTFNLSIVLIVILIILLLVIMIRRKRRISR